MLRFLRQYNAIILAIGASLLMVVFLMEPVMTRCDGGRGSQTIGYLDGSKITSNDIVKASNEMGILDALSPVLASKITLPPMFGGQTITMYNPTQWLLMKHEAEAVGISASTTEAREIMKAAGVNDVGIALAMKEYATTQDAIIEAVRTWSIVQQYTSLMRGRAYESVVLRLQSAMAQATAIVGRNGDPRQFAPFIFHEDIKQMPVSEPLLKRFVYDQRAQVKVTAVEVPGSLYDAKITPPTEQEKRSLFEKYKDELPGKGEPYGIGYRLPDRVKLEYIRFPYDRALEAVRVEEREAFDYYTQNKSKYIVLPEPPKPDAPKPDAPKPEAPKPDAPKPDAPKPDAPKPDAPKPDAPKPDEPKPDAPKPDEPKPDAPKPDAPKPEKPAEEQPKPPACQDETAPPEQPKTDAPKPDPAKPDPAKPDASKTEPPVAPPVEPPKVDLTPKQQPYEEVRKTIIDQLKREKAQKLIEDMVREAQRVLREDVASLPQEEGYYRIDHATFQPTPLSQVAERIQQRFKLLPDVTKLDADWLDQAALQRLDKFGEARVRVAGLPPMTEYVLSAQELQEKESKNRLLPMRLQTGVASLPLFEGDNYYLLRVTAAQKAGAPSYEERKEDVERDARRIAAFEALKKDREVWLKRARTEKVEDIAKQLNVSLLQLPAFSKRERDLSGRTGALVVPPLPTIGQSEAFVDYVFELAESAAKEGSIAGAKPEDLCGAVPVERRMSMIVLRVDEYKPITLADYIAAAGRGDPAFWVAAGIGAGGEVDPVSEDALAARLKFERDKGDRDNKSRAPRGPTLVE